MEQIASSQVVLDDEVALILLSLGPFADSRAIILLVGEPDV